MKAVALVSLILASMTKLANAEFGDTLPADVKRIISMGGATTAFDLILEDVAEKYLKSTPYSGRFRLNLSPKARYLNFYIFRRKALLDSNLAAATCNCRYIQRHESIVCDGDYVNEFIHQYGFDPNLVKGTDIAELVEKLNHTYKRFMAEWLFGHEIAHLVLNHEYSSANKAPELEVWGNIAELEADSYVASKFAHDTDLQNAAIFTLQEISRNLYNSLAEKQHAAKLKSANMAGKSSLRDMAFAVSVAWRPNRHPPWLIRALDFADILQRHYPSIDKDLGYWKRLRFQVKPRAMLTGEPFKPEIRCGDDPFVPTGKLDLDTAYITGNAELLDRMLVDDDGDLALAFARHLRQRGEFLGMFSEAWSDQYFNLIEIDRLWRSEADSQANEVLERVDLNSLSEFLKELSGSILYARTVARVDKNPLRRKNLIVAETANTERLLAESQQNEGLWTTRSMGSMALDLWETSARAYGFSAGSTQQSLLQVEQLLNGSSHELLKQDFLARWREIIDAALDDEDRITQLCLFFVQAESFGYDAEAARAGVELTKLINPSGPPEIRAYWNNRVGELMMKLRLSREAIVHETTSVRDRRELLSYSVRLDPLSIAHSTKQLGFALNQLGFSYLLDYQYSAALELLLESEALERKSAVVDEIALATIRHNLAGVYIATGNKDMALKYARLATEARAKYGAQPLSIQYSKQGLANAYYLNGNVSEARRLWQETERDIARISDFRMSTENILTNINGKWISIHEQLGDSALVSRRMAQVQQLSVDVNRYREIIYEEQKHLMGAH